MSRSGIKHIWAVLLFLFVFPGILPESAAQNNPEKTSRTVFIFLAETCPISQFYTLTLKDLHHRFASDQVRFVAVFPNSSSSPESIQEFKKLYQLPFSVQVDGNQELTKKLKAEITPEAIVQDDLSGKILYKGRIDDSYYRVGKRRQVVTSHDLRDALTELEQNQPVSKPETAAIGCYITLKP